MRYKTRTDETKTAHAILHWPTFLILIAIGCGGGVSSLGAGPILKPSVGESISFVRGNIEYKRQLPLSLQQQVVSVSKPLAWARINRARDSRDIDIPRSYVSVIEIDPRTGNRNAVAHANDLNGVEIVNPTAIAIAPNGDLLVTDAFWGRIIRVDPSNGQRTFLQSRSNRSAQFHLPGGISVTKDGAVIVSDTMSASVLELSVPLHKMRSLSVGLELQSPTAVALTRDDNVLVVDSAMNAILRIERPTGVTRVISSNKHGTGPQFGQPTGLATGPRSRAFVADAASGKVMTIEIETGNRSILSGGHLGNGAAFVAPRALAAESDASLLVVDYEQDTLFRVDTHTGDRTVLSSNEVGDGPELGAPVGVAIGPAGSIFVINLPRRSILPSLSESAGGSAGRTGGLAFFGTTSGGGGGVGGGFGFLAAAVAASGSGSTSANVSATPSTPVGPSTPIPEPSSFALMLIAAVGLIVAQRKRLNSEE